MNVISCDKVAQSGCLLRTKDWGDAQPPRESVPPSFCRMLVANELKFKRGREDELSRIDNAEVIAPAVRIHTDRLEMSIFEHVPHV